MLQEIVAEFREKGATSPEKAMTAQELGLPPRFEEAMKRRLGAMRIFVEVSGKFYLDEARLQQIQQQRGETGGGRAARRNILAVRTARMVLGIAVIGLVVTNLLFVGSPSLRLVTLDLVLVWITLTAFQLYYLGRARGRMGASGFAGASP